jgi:hypothetical protein
MYTFATPPIKLKPGQQIGGGLLIANHLDQSLWCANQKHWVAVISYLVHFYKPRATCTIMLRQNHFPEPNRHALDFLHLILRCRVTYWAPLEMLLQVLRCQRIWFTMNEFFFIATNHGHIPWFYFTKLSFIYEEMVLHMITITHVHCLSNAHLTHYTVSMQNDFISNMFMLSLAEMKIKEI